MMADIWDVLGGAGLALAVLALLVAVSVRGDAQRRSGVALDALTAERQRTEQLSRDVSLLRREVQSLESRIATVREDSLASIKRLSELEANVKIDDPSWPVLRSYGERGPEVRDVHSSD